MTMPSVGVPPQQARHHPRHPLEHVKCCHPDQHPAAYAQAANPPPPRVPPSALVRVWQHVKENVGQQRARRKASGNDGPSPAAATVARPTKPRKREDAH